MAERAEERLEQDHAIAAYKRLLKTYLDRRPSGTRQKVAEALGTHKSFVSQITNPNYRVPLPAQHVGTIAKICHLSPEEMREFLAAYQDAHPSQALGAREDRAEDSHILRIEVPHFEDPGKQRDVEDTIKEIAARIIALAR